jgi:uncharacterized cupredoxin-like copper-binding protein
MKCIYSETFKQPRCDKDAEYIFLGKSYCAEHLEIRANEAHKEMKLHEEKMEKLRENLKDMDDETHDKVETISTISCTAEPNLVVKFGKGDFIFLISLFAIISFVCFFIGLTATIIENYVIY